MSSKPTLSPSRISTYLACPVKYRWTFVDRRGKWLLRSRSYYSFGTTLHSVLERFHDSDDRGVTTTLEAIAALEESWIDAGYESQEEMAQAMAEGKAIVEAYTEAMAAEPATSRTRFVEMSLRADLGPFELVGRIDRLEEHEDGRLEIVDYKTLRETVAEDEVRFDLAMGCYQLLVSRNFPDRPVSATIVALRGRARATVAFTAEELAEFESALVELGKEIIAREYEMVTPKPKELCRGCDFLSLCRKHEDFILPNEPGSGSDPSIPLGET
ncbi:MAG: PD-(D/E)XK nuclease family protein [Fimbriimonadaceae bacterium]|nr:PD-(D/E)XK nuclease family protein [Fimbriimonadaceae bacterium]QYK55116.1 MAG: PD-(D/E)XK nuclease family protein [Fimbriimonadaceae bacterium]